MVQTCLNLSDQVVLIHVFYSFETILWIMTWTGKLDFFQVSNSAMLSHINTTILQNQSLISCWIVASLASHSSLWEVLATQILNRTCAQCCESLIGPWYMEVVGRLRYNTGGWGQVGRLYYRPPLHPSTIGPYHQSSMHRPSIGWEEERAGSWLGDSSWHF